MAPSQRKSTKKAEVGTERLDVEEDEARQKRLQSLLEHLSAPSTHPAATTPAFPSPLTGFPKFDFGDRRTEAVVPDTELLSRIQAFLPQLEASNRELLARAKADLRRVDIENVSGKVGRVIEMNLGLGVFEEKQGRKKSAKGPAPLPPPSSKAGSDDEAMVSSPSSSSTSSTSSSSDDLDSSDDIDSDSDSDSNSGSSSQAEDEGPNDPLTNLFASLGSALDTSASSSSPDSDSDSDSDDGGDGEDEDPLTMFFDSLHYGQTISMDSSDEESEEGDSDRSNSDEDDEERRAEDRKGKETREVKSLPKRARPRIEVIGDEAPVEVQAGDMGGV